MTHYTGDTLFYSEIVVRLRVFLLAFVSVLPTISPVAQERGIVPVVGSTAGAFGSEFRTQVQMTNRGTVRITGFLVFRSAGATGEVTTRSLPYAIEPHGMLTFDDVVVALGTMGLGTLDIRPLAGSLPAVVVRAFDDQGESGTSGATVRMVRRVDALDAGERTLLIVPADLERFRFNVGIRALEDGAVTRFKVYTRDGVQRVVVEKVWDADRFQQSPASDLVGTTLLANESIEVEVASGAAVVYGTSTDNQTNDPSVQIGRALADDSTKGTVPVVGSTEGAFDSLFRTELQLSNPSMEMATGSLVLHRAALVGEEEEPLTLEYSLTPHETISYLDIVGELRHSGLGSLDVVASSGALPVVVARAFDDAPEGSKGVTVPMLLSDEATGAGETTALLIPDDLESFRFNIGYRTLEPNTTFQMSVYDDGGDLVAGLPVATVDEANAFMQHPAGTILGDMIPPNGSVVIQVFSGAGFFYGTMTDNRTNDSSLQIEEIETVSSPLQVP